MEQHNETAIAGTTSTHVQCREIVEIMIAAGVRHAVVSPGSRNAPLLIALAREPRISKWVITDERSAAFAAIGIAQRLLQPVMIVCTSGSALLDYAPAIAEAYYRQIPIIAVSQQNRESTEETGVSTRNIAQSDRIGQDSTTIIFIEKKDDIMTLYLGKSRDSVVGAKLSYRVNLDTGTFDYIPSQDDATDGEGCENLRDEYEYRSDDTEEEEYVYEDDKPF